MSYTNELWLSQRICDLEEKLERLQRMMILGIAISLTIIGLLLLLLW